MDSEIEQYGEEVVLSVYARELGGREKVIAQTEVLVFKKVTATSFEWHGPEGLKLEEYQTSDSMWITRVTVSNPQELQFFRKETELWISPLFLKAGETLTLTFPVKLIVLREWR